VVSFADQSWQNLCGKEPADMNILQLQAGQNLTERTQGAGNIPADKYAEVSFILSIGFSSWGSRERTFSILAPHGLDVDPHAQANAACRHALNLWLSLQ
jgi:hypothetical protein